jgi:hypothetical protein
MRKVWTYKKRVSKAGGVVGMKAANAKLKHYLPKTWLNLIAR